MTITIEKPETLCLMYRQEKTDEDYGSCMWARFYFDLKNYTLHIESDCGNYTYGWYPTPDTESFMKLCARFDYYYLLDKMSSRSIIDSEKTWKAVKELVEQLIDDFSLDNLDEYEWEQLESACYHAYDERDVFDSITEVLNHTELRGKYETEDFWYAIEKDYPANSKKIFSVFIDCIQPFIKAMKEETGNENY